MSLQILKRPIGVKLGDCVSATIDEDYSGVATVNYASHGLSTGDYVYVTSNIEDYNGFWPIFVQSSTHFYLVEDDGSYVPFVVNANITYCPQESTHGWSCVHLPITYKISNNLYPTNEVDATRTVSSFSNDNGYVNLNLSGSLGTFNELAFVKITGAFSEDVNGVFQIFDKVSSSDITINLAYDSTYSFSGGTVQLYYTNYDVVVRVYAGLNSSHTWEARKPYELAATLELIPDENNEVHFSINEILKGYISVKNNLLLATLPNNIDFFTQFYIEIAESYDFSNGYSLATYTSSYTSDQSTFEGVAVNSVLEFKNQYSGYLTEYMNNKFLTLFAIPVLFSCDDTECYTDISLLNKYETLVNIKLSEAYYINDSLQTTLTTDHQASSLGVYRLPLSTVDCDYDRVDVSATGQAVPESLSTFSQTSGLGTDLSYVSSSPVNAALQVTLTTGASSEIGYVKMHLPPGTYNIGGTSDANVLSGSGTYRVRYYLLARDLTQLDVSSYMGVTSGSPDTNAENLTATDEVYYIGLQFQFTSGSGSVQMSGTLLAATGGESIFDSFVSVPLTEIKEFSIDCGCSNQDIRLTWLNNLGGFDYWKFTAYKDNLINIKETGETSKNIFPQWPKSYGSFADTIRKQTFRNSERQIVVRSQNLTLDQLQAIEYIKSSVLVQVIESRSDRRTVLVDADSFTSYKDDDKLYSISFTITYTNDIPSQRA